MTTSVSIAKKLTWASLFVLALFLFTSFSLSAGHHIFIVFPGFYFLIKALQSSDFKFSKSSKALFVLWLVSFLSVIWHFNEYERPIKFMLNTKYLLFGFLAIPAFYYFFKDLKDKNKIRLLINVILFSTTLASASGLIGAFSGFNPLRLKAACHEYRTCGMYGMYMSYAYGIQFFVVLLAGLLYHRKKYAGYFNLKLVLIAFFINVAGLYFSYARGALVATMLAIPFYFYKKNKRLFLKLIVGVLLAFAIGLTIFPRLRATFMSRDRMDSATIRFSYFQSALYAFTDNPLLGMGYKNFEPNVLKIKEKYKIIWWQYLGHAHNNFLEHLASTGIIGFIAIFLFHLYWWRELMAGEGWSGTFGPPFMIVLLISGMVQYTLGDGETLFLIMPFYALTQVDLLKQEPL